MNDPNKRIDVNISSLLSLKAELLRKQEEVNRTKLKQSSETFIPKKITKPESRETPEPEKTTRRFEEYEDSALLDKSRKVLEAKSRFYDKMTASGGKLNSDDNCLVMFNQKKQVSEAPKESSSESDISDDENATGKYKSNNSDDEWVEYTDCLGRTRQCLKKDLEFFKKKDNQLADNIQPRMELNQDAPMWMIDTNATKATESVMADDKTELTSMMSKHDQQKMSWEKKEEENVYKENVHYQDVLFDEARTHGVGYYAFATDDEERAKQMKALDAMREKTLEQQKQRETQRLAREKIIAERVKAAKNRQRARLGLPPVEDEPEPEPEPAKLYDSRDEAKRKKREEKEKRRKEREEKKREGERKRHVRPWDKNKAGVPPTNGSSDSDSDNEWNYKPEREPMSQEQWNERLRQQRNPDFAPMAGPPPPPPPPLRQFRAPASNVMYNEDIGPNPLFFTTKKHQDKPPAREFMKRNYAASMDDEEEIPFDELNDRQPSSRGAEIAPPPTYDYYGPTSAKREKVARPDLERSIEAGLKFLRNQSDKGVLPTKSSWTANADY